MIKYNFQRLFTIKGIVKPFSFLVNAGFSHNFATKVKNNRVNRLNVEMIERLCIALNCSPNDLMEFIPDNDNYIDKNHPLFTLQRTDKILKINKILSRMTLEEINEIQSIINDRSKTNSKE